MELKEALAPIRRKQVETKSNSLVSSEVVSVTADIAESYLSTSNVNRKRKEKTVIAYAREMLAGNWQLNGETLIFNRDGCLIQGHHRMNAVLAAAKVKPMIEVPMLVVRGVDVEAFDTLDQGSKRSVADVLYIRGESYHIVLASVVRYIGVIEQGGHWNAQFSVREIEAGLAAHSRARYWSRELGKSPVRRFMPSMFASVLTLADEKHSTRKAQEFFNKVESGESLADGDPALTLRRRFLEARSKRAATRMTGAAALHYICAAWNHNLAGEPLYKLIWRENLPAPTVK